jgi:hypothetical protein
VRPGGEVVAGFGPAPAADIPRKAVAGARAASLRGGCSLLQCALLGFREQIRLHPLRQLHGHLGVASLGAVDRIIHPIRYHSVQHLVSSGVLLAGQEVAGAEDSAAGEFDADRLPDQVQLVHDVKDTLSGGGVLDDEVDAVCVTVTAGDQDVAREWCEDVDFPLPAQLHYLFQSRIHRPKEDPGSDGQVAHHMVLAVLQLFDGADGAVTGHVHEARVVHGVDDNRETRFGYTVGLQKAFDDVDVGGGQGPAARRHVHRRLANVVEGHPQSPSVAATNHDDGGLDVVGRHLIPGQSGGLPVHSNNCVHVPFVDSVKPLNEGGIQG